MERPQPAVGMSLTRPLRRTDGRLDPAALPGRLEHQIRVHQPWPGTYLETDAGRLIVWRAGAFMAETSEGAPELPHLVRIGDGVALANREGSVALLEVQPAGGRRMAASDWVRGIRTLPALVEVAPDGPQGGSALG